MDGERFARELRALRRRAGLTQAELARTARVSQATVSRAENRGAGCLRGDVLERLVAPLGARVETRLRWQGEGLDRLVDARHAALVDAMVRRLRRRGWEAAVEVTFSVYGERGSVDVLAYHPGTGALLVIEVKSVVPDLQAMLGALDRKVRLAPGIARSRGWEPRTVSTLLVLADTTTNRRRVAAHAATFEARLPARAANVRSWLRRPADTIAGLVFLFEAAPRR